MLVPDPDHQKTYKRLHPPRLVRGPFVRERPDDVATRGRRPEIPAQRGSAATKPEPRIQIDTGSNAPPASHDDVLAIINFGVTVGDGLEQAERALATITDALRRSQVPQHQALAEALSYCRVESAGQGGNYAVWGVRNGDHFVDVRTDSSRPGEFKLTAHCTKQNGVGSTTS